MRQSKHKALGPQAQGRQGPAPKGASGPQGTTSKSATKSQGKTSSSPARTLNPKLTRVSGATRRYGRPIS